MLHAVSCPLFGRRGLLFDVLLLAVVCCWLFVGCCSLFVVCCLLFEVWCTLYVFTVCRLSAIVCDVLNVVVFGLVCGC